MQSNLQLSSPTEDTLDADPTPPPAPIARDWPLFEGFLKQGETTRRDRWRRWRTCGLSMALHGLVLIAMVVLAARGAKMVAADPALAVSVPVTLGLRVPAPGPVAAAAAARSQQPAKPKPRPAPVVRPRPTSQPTPVVAADHTVAADDDRDDKEAAANETSTEGAATSGGGGGTVLATVASAPAAPALSASDVRALLARYTQEILRTRIAANLVYPPEAERVGAEGTVVVRVRVNSAGAVISAAVVGACAHELLCEDALRTVRAASPFPPPPPVLGALIDVSVPVTYRLE